MITVVELPEFVRRAKRLLSEDELRKLINHLAANPTAGVRMQGTGGIRKLRWKREGTGKSSGVRVIHFGSLRLGVEVSRFGDEEVKLFHRPG